MKEYKILTGKLNKEEKLKYISDLSYALNIRLNLKQNEEELIIFVDDENYDFFIETISLYLSYYKYISFLESQLSNHFSDDKLRRIVSNYARKFKKEFYFHGLTRIKVELFFRANNVLKIKSFLKFNLNGIAKDLERTIEKEIKSDGNLIGNYNNELQNVFKFFKMIKNSRKNEINEIKSLFISSKNEKIILKDENDKVLNIEYYSNEFNFKVSTNKKFSTEQSLFFIELLVNIYELKSIVIVGPFKEEMQVKVEKLLKKYNDKKFKVFFSKTKKIL